MRYAQIVPKIAILFIVGLATGCIDSDAVDPPPPPEPQPQYDFSVVDARLQELLDASDAYDGVSYVVVDKDQGVIYETAKGDHTPELVVLLAGGASELPVASLVMALNDDASLDFDIETRIDTYVSWPNGLYGDRSMAHLLSHTSGIPASAFDMCQINSTVTLDYCSSVIYAKVFPNTVAAGTQLALATPPYQLAGGVAEVVTKSTWAQAFDKYIAQPCELEVMQFGNIYSADGTWNGWTGSPDSLKGLNNPMMWAGGISDTQDMARLLLMHLRDGKCGDAQVLSPGTAATMRDDRTDGLVKAVPPAQQVWGHSLSWWVVPSAAGEIGYAQFGGFGSLVWLDSERSIAGFLAVDNYPNPPPSNPKSWEWAAEINAMVRQAVDEARAAVGQ